MSANPGIHPRQAESYVAVASGRDVLARISKRVLPQVHPASVKLPAVKLPVEPAVSPWCVSPLKRFFDLACVIPALLLLSPIMLAVAVLVWLTSDGPILFRQERTGLHRRAFIIYKFRTMYHDPVGSGPCVTKTGDTRLTSIGGFLRKYKLDELPQLYNVLRGDMSLVGPRPKLPHLEPSELRCRPGVTGAATLEFSKEENILLHVPSEQVEDFYVRVIAPLKVDLDQTYQAQATFFTDFRLLVDTVLGRRIGLDIHDLVSGVRDPEPTGHIVTLWAAEQVSE